MVGFSGPSLCPPAGKIAAWWGWGACLQADFPTLPNAVTLGRALGMKGFG